MTTKISIVLTRDSVCAGDDADAPHETRIETDVVRNPVDFARRVASGYLASVAGVGHSWFCVMNGVTIAEIKTTGIIPLVDAVPFAEENTVHFTYKSARF